MLCFDVGPSGVYFCRSVLLVYVLLFTKSGKVCFCIVLKPQERKCLLSVKDFFGNTWDLPICLLRIIDEQSIKQYSTKSGPVYLFIGLIVQTL